jgi:class 3 adenylate cyclase
VDLVLLDILMPDLSGYDILGRNRDLLQSKNIPVIVVSSLDEQETVYRCLESGAQDFITKPVNFMILAARINSALERKYLLDREEDHLRRIESEKQKNEELLLNILPQPIAQRMKANEYLIADSVSDCSILFGDIVGFTPLSQALGPIKIVDMLNQIFSTFDDFCEELGVEKIKTIGDNYMVACGVPTPDPQHAVKAVTMGERMLRFVEALPDMQGHRIAMRIGVHSGPAVAGVIGKKKFVYDLWGDAVNTAGRMETYGLPNCLHMSDATAELVRDHFELEARGSLDIKGIGDMQTHLLKRRR